MLRRIKLYGSLAKHVGKRVLYAEVQSPAEAVRFLVANWPSLKQHMANRHYKVGVGERYIEPLSSELHMEDAGKTIKIVPVVVGAGGAARAITTIVVGVALVAAAIFIPGSTLFFGTAFSSISLSVGVMGAGLILAGASSLVSPATPVFGPMSALSAGGSGNSGLRGQNTDKDPRKSYSFNNIQQVSRQGVAVPVVYGETIVGSVVVSAGIDVVRIKKKKK